MNDLFVGAVDFRSDGLGEQFDGQVYCLSTDEGLAPHTITDSNSIVTPSSRRAAATVLDVLEADDEEVIEQLYETVRSLEEDEPWSEALEDGLAGYSVIFNLEDAEAAAMDDEYALKTGLHNYLVRQHHIYRPYSLKTEAYHAGKIPDWQEPAEETGLLDRYVDYTVSGLDAPDKLPEQMRFMAAVKRRVEKERE